MQKLELSSELLIKPFDEVGTAVLREVPLVCRDDDATPLPIGFAGNRRVLIGRAL